MKLLLDTHTFLWLTKTPEVLPATVSEALTSQENECLLSIASLWEMTVKGAKNKLDLPGGDIRRTIEILGRSTIQTLLIESLDLPYLWNLPTLHRDPFDRILVAQALRHGMTLVTVDGVLSKYGVSVLWK